MASDQPFLSDIRLYWNERIHDLEMTDHPVGSREFFAALDEYRFDKLRYLPQVVDFDGYRDQALLEVGCGIGTDLVRFARGGARVTGIDLAERSVELAMKNLAFNGVADGADLRVANGEAMPFPDSTFDVVYAHGVLQYTADPARMIAECHRVLKTSGVGIFMVYNRVSWLSALSKVMQVPLEHEDARCCDCSRSPSTGGFWRHSRAATSSRSASRSRHACTAGGRVRSTTVSSSEPSPCSPGAWCGRWAGT